jgi:hypothetical protein
VNKHLVLVHGRAQQGKDATELKATWVDALNRGLKKSSLSLPINPHTDVTIAYYGDTLNDLVSGLSQRQAAEVILRGIGVSHEERQFARDLFAEVLAARDLSEAEVQAELDANVIEKGLLEQEWFQGVLRLLDDRVPGASAASIALFTHDVYQYLRNESIRIVIEDGVAAALVQHPGSVVVAHSLGTVIAYRLLVTEGDRRGWKVPTLVTVGSPLAIKAIKRFLQPIRRPECVARWFNALDERDVVALYPLDAKRFPMTPPTLVIHNKTDVMNDSQNHHGIVEYLEDREVARNIYDALR